MTTESSGPLRPATRPSQTSSLVAANVRLLRKVRGWSAQRLADNVAEAGHVLPRVAVAKIEKCGRMVTVDDLVAIASGFGVPAAMLIEVLCEVCCGSPPAGFACRSCGAES
jgi:transcriptional regulator with XRE-family HTH domain